MRSDELVGLIREAVPERDETVRLGTVSMVSGASATIQFDGETSASSKKYLAVNYTPVAGDRVALLRAGHSWIIIGKVGSRAEHTHDVVVNTALQDDDNRSLILPWNSELVNWKERGGTITETFTGSFSGFGGDVYDLVRPHSNGAVSRSFTPDPAGQIYWDVRGVAFQAWADLHDRKPWLRVRAGQRPSRITVQAEKPAGTWTSVHTDESPTFVNGTWLGPNLPSSAWPDSAPHTINGIRFLLTFAGTSVCYLNSFGLAHPNIPFGWHALPNLRTSQTFSNVQHFDHAVEEGQQALGHVGNRRTYSMRGPAGSVNGQFLIAQFGRDVNNWSTNGWTVEITTDYYQSGYWRGHVSYGYNQAGTVTAFESVGASAVAPTLGTEFSLGGSIYMRALEVTVPAYMVKTVRITGHANVVATEPKTNEWRPLGYFR